MSTKQYLLRDFQNTSRDLKDDAVAAFRHFREGISPDNANVKLSGKTWQLYTEAAEERTLWMSNNDGGVAKCGFLIENADGLTLDGEGAMLVTRGPQGGVAGLMIAHTLLVPIVIRNSRNIIIRNLAIDWHKPFMAQGRIVAVAANSIDVEVESESRWWVWNGYLFFDLEGVRVPMQRIVAVEPGTGALAPKTCDNLGNGWEMNWFVTKLDDKRVRLQGPMPEPPKVGQYILFWMAGFDTAGRQSSAIFIENSENIRLENVSIHHAWGMGVLAQLSRNLHLDNVKIEPRPGSGRLFSTTADATHFSGCGGSISLTNCVIKNQMDDGLACHGNYAEVLRRFDDRTLRVKRGHSQQRGVEITRAGNTCEIVRQSDLTIVDTNQVKTITDLNSETADITFEKPLPAEIGAGYAVEDMEFQPNLTIENCVFKHSKPRGALVMTAGKVRVRRCYFETPGPGIKVIGCADRVYESGHIRDMVVEECQFVECCQSPQWGLTSLVVAPEIHNNQTRTDAFHRNITIRNNVFENCAGGMIEYRSVDNLVLENNRECAKSESVKD